MKTNRTSTIRRAGPFCLGLVAATLLPSCAELDQALVAAIGAAGAQGYAHTSGYAPSTHSAWNPMNPANFSLKPNHNDWENLARNVAMNYARTAAYQARHPSRLAPAATHTTLPNPASLFLSNGTHSGSYQGSGQMMRVTITDWQSGRIIQQADMPASQTESYIAQFPGCGSGVTPLSGNWEL